MGSSVKKYCRRKGGIKGKGASAWAEGASQAEGQHV